MKFPNVQDVLSLTDEDLKMWSIVATYQVDTEAYWGIFGLNHMPWQYMPRAEGQAVCFMRGGGADDLTADAVLFKYGVWHHIQIQAVRAGKDWKLAVPNIEVDLG